MTINHGDAFHSFEMAAQQAAEQHLEACWAFEHGEVDDAPDFSAPFCGCETCQVREVLHAAWPHLRQGLLVEAVVRVQEALRGFDGEPGHGGEMISVNYAQMLVQETLLDLDEEDDL